MAVADRAEWAFNQTTVTVATVSPSPRVRACSAVSIALSLSLSLSFSYVDDPHANAGVYIDKKCPFTGNVSIRGRILTAGADTRPLLSST